MTASDVMTRVFEVVHPEAGMGEVAARFKSGHGLALPVCENGRLIGMISSREIGEPDRESERTPWCARRVRDVIAPDLLFCFETTDLAEASQLMRQNHVDRLPVLGPDRRLVGMLALDSLPLEESGNGHRRERGSERA